MTTTAADAAGRRDARRLRGLAERTDLAPIMLAHAGRGARAQQLLRGVLALFVLVTVVAVPPADDRSACLAAAGGYTAWAIVVAVASLHGGALGARFVWLAAFGDVASLALVALLASASDQQSWTTDVVLNGFFVIPTIAATQLRPWVCAVVGAPTVAVYLACSAAAAPANGEPWSSVLLRVLILSGLTVGCVLLSRIQRSRVAAIGALAAERSQLLDEIVAVEHQERTALAEQLHDGALQYVLAARQDLTDARASGDPEAFRRAEEALLVSGRLLRSTVSELHPAVLEQAGLLAALRELAHTAESRGLVVLVVDDGWGVGRRTDADPALFAAARELLGNAVKHAGAATVCLRLGAHAGAGRLTVSDDGRGIDPAVLSRRLAEGHIGLASRRIRIEAAGGQLHVAAAPEGGTVATVEVPL